MTTIVKAIYEDGVLKPKSPLHLEEHTEVELLVMAPVARVVDRIEGKLSDYVRSLPPGTRSKDDVDQQIREERDSWS
jgi:predicted DNA-binding antitoxin AbrB/MazE fold protein